MDREPPPVTVTAPRSGGPPPDVLASAPPGQRRRSTVVVLALVAATALGASAVRGGDADGDAEPVPSGPPVRTATSGITATASLAGASTAEQYVQRLALTVDLPAFDGRSDSGGRLLGDEVRLLGVRLRGFTVEVDDRSVPLQLGRFGRANEPRSTTVPLEAVVDDCSIGPQARRDIDLTVRTGAGPDGVVRAVADTGVVRALDRLVARTCRRPRG